MKLSSVTFAKIFNVLSTVDCSFNARESFTWFESPPESLGCITLPQNGFSKISGQSCHFRSSYFEVKSLSSFTGK
jgi:hypothetical protein